MELSVYRIIVAIIALYFIMNRLLRFIKREPRQSIFKLITICFVWSLIFILAIFPHVSPKFFTLIGLKQDRDGLLLIIFTMIFLVIFRLLSIIEKLEKNITTIVREMAIEKTQNTKSGFRNKVQNKKL